MRISSAHLHRHRFVVMDLEHHLQLLNRTTITAMGRERPLLLHQDRTVIAGHLLQHQQDKIVTTPGRLPPPHIDTVAIILGHLLRLLQCTAMGLELRHLLLLSNTLPIRGSLHRQKILDHHLHLPHLHIALFIPRINLRAHSISDRKDITLHVQPHLVHLHREPQV